jgi:arginyl-tRNA synthetase
VGFGLVLGSDGKRFRTRSSEVVRLVELLDEAKTRSKAELIQRLENNGILFVFLIVLFWKQISIKYFNCSIAYSVCFRT